MQLFMTSEEVHIYVSFQVWLTVYVYYVFQHVMQGMYCLEGKCVCLKTCFGFSLELWLTNKAKRRTKATQTKGEKHSSKTSTGKAKQWKWSWRHLWRTWASGGRWTSRWTAPTSSTTRRPNPASACRRPWPPSHAISPSSTALTTRYDHLRLEAASLHFQFPYFNRLLISHHLTDTCYLKKLVQQRFHFRPFPAADINRAMLSSWFHSKLRTNVLPVIELSGL